MAHPLVAPCQYEDDGRPCGAPGGYEAWYTAVLCVRHERVMRKFERGTEIAAPTRYCAGVVTTSDGSMRELVRYRTEV